MSSWKWRPTSWGQTCPTLNTMTSSWSLMSSAGTPRGRQPRQLTLVSSNWLSVPPPRTVLEPLFFFNEIFLGWSYFLSLSFLFYAPFFTFYIHPQCANAPQTFLLTRAYLVHMYVAIYSKSQPFLSVWSRQIFGSLKTALRKLGPGWRFYLKKTLLYCCVNRK